MVNFGFIRIWVKGYKKAQSTQRILRALSFLIQRNII